MKEIKQTETRVEISVDTKQATLASLQFPFEKDALNAIETYWKKGYDYVQLGIGTGRNLNDLCRSLVVFLHYRPGGRDYRVEQQRFLQHFRAAQ